MYTTTTHVVRVRYHLATVSDDTPEHIIEMGRERSYEEFDRWITSERAKVWDEAVNHQWKHRPLGNRSPHNPYREGS